MSFWTRLRQRLWPARPKLSFEPLPPMMPDVAHAPRIAPGSAGDLAPEPTISPERVRRVLIKAFDSTHPVADRRDLFGRDRELEELTSAMLDQGQHVLVHGARGSGKTSIVRIFGDLADQSGAIVIYMACEPGATFAETLRPFLSYIPGAVLDGIDPAAFVRRAEALPADFSPRTLVELLSHVRHRRVIFILDEFDRVIESDVVSDMASFMKLLTDALSRVQVMLVGIAHSVDAIIAGHPSLRRHMHVTSLGRITPASVGEIIEHGERMARITFDEEVKRTVTRIAVGSPYHVRLFCRFIGIAATEQKTLLATREHARLGIQAAYADWARTNIGDSRLFTRLTGEAGASAQLEAVARLAANEDLVDDSDLAALGVDPAQAAALDNAIVADGRQVGKSLFRDTTAPQFLIASIVLNEYSRSDAGARAPAAAVRSELTR